MKIFSIAAAHLKKPHAATVADFPTIQKQIKHVYETGKHIRLPGNPNDYVVERHMCIADLTPSRQEWMLWPTGIILGARHWLTSPCLPQPTWSIELESYLNSPQVLAVHPNMPQLLWDAYAAIAETIQLVSRGDLMDGEWQQVQALLRPQIQRLMGLVDKRATRAWVRENCWLSQDDQPQWLADKEKYLDVGELVCALRVFHPVWSYLDYRFSGTFGRAQLPQTYLQLLGMADGWSMQGFTTSYTHPAWGWLREGSHERLKQVLAEEGYPCDADTVDSAWLHGAATVMSRIGIFQNIIAPKGERVDGLDPHLRRFAMWLLPEIVAYGRRPLQRHWMRQPKEVK